MRAVACETHHLAVEKISAHTEWCDRVRKSEKSFIQKPLMQFGERCHWLEAERITHMYDPRWGTGVWLGRHSASDAHLIGTPGGVIHVVVLETIRTGAMRVVHITVNIEETQKLRIKFVLVLSCLNSNTTSLNNLHCTVLPVHTNTSKSTFPFDN